MPRIALRLLAPLLLLLTLSACVAYPYGYTDGGYYAPTVAVPVYPSVGYRGGYSGGGGYGGHGHHYR